MTIASLTDLLAYSNLAAVAREIGRPRGFVWRLAHGAPLRDRSVVPALARVLRVDAGTLDALVVGDARKLTH